MIIKNNIFYSTSMNSSEYLTVPALPLSAPSVSSIAINTSSGTSKEHFIFHLEALLKPNFG